MIHRNFKYLLCLLILISSVCRVISQDFTNAQRRDINLKVYSLIADYTRYGKFSSNYSTIDANYVTSFESLFDRSALLLNDVLPANEKYRMITLDQYIELIRKYYPHGFGFTLANIQLGIPSRSHDGTYNMYVEADKEISGTTGNNASYKDIVEIDFKLRFTMSGEEVSDIAIEQIGGTYEGLTLRLLYIDKKNHPLPNLKLKLMRTGNKRMVPGEDVLISNEISDTIMTTDHAGRIHLENLAPYQEYMYVLEGDEFYLTSDPFYVKDIIREIPFRNDREYFDPNELISVLRPARLIASIYMAPSLSGKNIRFQGYESFRSDSTNWNNNNYVRAQDFYAGLQIGYKTLNKNNFDLVLMSGIELSRFTGKITADSYNTWFYRFDGAENYERQVSLSNFSQTIRTSGISVPVHFLLRFRKRKKININIETGINMNFFTNHSYDVLKGEKVLGTYQGFYSQYLDLIIDNDTTLGFGMTEYGEEDRKWNGKSYAISIYFSPTLSKWITRNTEVYFGPVFNYGIKDISNNTEPLPLTSEMNEFNSITDMADQVKFGALFLELGLRYRFTNFASFKKLPQ